MRVSFSLQYHATLEPDQVAKLQDLVDRPLEWDEPKEDAEDQTRYLKAWTTYTADLRDLLKVVPAHLIGLKGTPEPQAWLILEEQMAKLREAVEKSVQSGPQWNERVQVAVPGLGLLQIQEVAVQYDLCTDGLQNMLNEGWRILAVCPQPDQRRPDYVLGRTRQEDF